jgi:CheY-like chemotaxis protein
MGLQMKCKLDGLLKTRGYFVTITEDGRTAMEASFDRGQIDVVLMDIP